MYFLSMKIQDGNNSIPIMSETNEEVHNLVGMAETMFEFLTRNRAWDMSVIDNNFNQKKMSDAGCDLIDGKINDFEWSFIDKYDRKVSCYITSNV